VALSPCDDTPGAWRLPACAVLLVATAFASIAAAATDSSRTAVLAQTGVEADADDFYALKIRGGALVDYRSDLEYFGIAAQNTRYSQHGWDANVPGILGLYCNQRRDTLEGVRAEIGLVSESGHARVVGDATWDRRLGSSTGVELIGAGDVVGTRQAIEQGIAYYLAAASVEQQFGQRLTGIALVGWQPFTDGNSRTLLRGRLIWSVLPEEGLSAQVRWRQYQSSSNDVGGAYFNPGQYRNWDAGLSLRRRIGTWRVSGLAGAGRERSDSGPWRTTAIAEVRAEAPLAGDVRIAASLLYNRAAGFANSPDYWYGTANVSVIIPLAR
jgi:hypothetical protein